MLWGSVQVTGRIKQRDALRVDASKLSSIHGIAVLPQGQLHFPLFFPASQS
jgi:hypothetical protein